MSTSALFNRALLAARSSSSATMATMRGSRWAFGRTCKRIGTTSPASVYSSCSFSFFSTSRTKALTRTTTTSSAASTKSLSTNTVGAGSGGPAAAAAASSSSRAVVQQQPPQLVSSPRHGRGRYVHFETTFDLPDHSITAAGYDAVPHHASELQLTKIVATIGPTSEQLEPLSAVTAAGMRIMRLNFSHATKEEVELRVANLAAAQKALTPAGMKQVQNVRSVLLDTAGPEIRTGKLAGDVSGHETVQLQAGSRVVLHSDLDKQHAAGGSTAEALYIDYPGLSAAVSEGQKVLLDDGAVVLTVSQVRSDGTVTATVDCTGTIRSRAGVNLPGADTTDLPALSDKDRADILYGMREADIDFVAASFVQSADHVRQIRQHVRDCAEQLDWHNQHDGEPPNTRRRRPLPAIISKIESVSALRKFDEILAASDGIMVARGDLGVEIPLQQVCNAQKEMVAAAVAAGKPVIVATQMLESMSDSTRPTRAEVADVTNAVYDGADAVMTSGETAKGRYPVETIRMMNDIVLSAERFAAADHTAVLGLDHVTKLYRGALGMIPNSNKDDNYDDDNANRTTNNNMMTMTADAAVAAAAVKASRDRVPGCVAILVLTDDHDDDTAGDCQMSALVAANRPAVPILSFCSTSKVARRLQIHRAVHPVVGALSGVPVQDRKWVALQELRAAGVLKTGDEVVIVSQQEEVGLGKAASMKIVTAP